MTLKKVLTKIKEYLLVALAGSCNAFSMHTFINPSKLVPGGFSGLASLLYYITDINVSILYFGLNIPLLVWALVSVKGDFTLKTIWSTVVSTVILAVLPEKLVFTESILIAVLFGAVLVGTSMFLASHYNGSNGGTEVIARIVHKKNPDINLSTVVMIANMSVYVIGSLVLVVFQGENLWVPVYSLIYILCGSKIMELMSLGIDRPQRFVIVTDKHEEMQDAITQRFKRGATVVDTFEADMSLRPHKMLTVICQYRQMAAMKRTVLRCDSNAFVYIKDVHDVFSRPTFNRSYKYDRDTDTKIKL